MLILKYNYINISTSNATLNEVYWKCTELWNTQGDNLIMDFTVLAQTDQVMEQVNVFLQTMRPDTLGDILVYLVFFIALITTFMLADGNDLAGNLLYATIVLALFNVTVGPEWYNDSDIVRAFPAFVARVAMFLLPFIAAGAARSKKNKGKMALPLSILAGVIGLVYAIGAFALPSLMDQVLF